MTEALQKFEFGEKPLRVTHKDAAGFWFIAGDVCTILDIRNPRHALSRLDTDEKGVVISDTLGGPQEVSVVSEPGLYSLTMTSRKPQAKAFKRFVTHEVLPSLRERGYYRIEKKPLTALEGVAQQAQLLATLAMEAEATRKTAEDAKLLAEKAHQEVQVLRQVQQEAEATIPGLPDPTETPGYRTTRNNVNEIIRSASIRSGVPFQDLWARAYRELRDRCKFDARARARTRSLKLGRKVQVMDIIEGEGMMDKFYAICHDLFGRPSSGVPRCKS